MSAINRTNIIAGPALIQFGGQTFWSKGPVTLKPVFKQLDIASSSFGTLGKRFVDRRIEVSFEPAGQYSDALAAVLWCYASTAIGTSIYGSDDSPLVIWGRDGRKETVVNAALTQMPNISRAVNKTLAASVTFTGLIGKNKEPNDADAYTKSEAAAYPGDAGFDPAQIFTLAAPASWGSTPWDVIRSQAGWDVAFALKFSEYAVDGLGTIDMRLQDLSVTVKGQPVGFTVSDIMTALEFGTKFGQARGGENFVVNAATVGAPVFTLFNAVMIEAEGFSYDATKERVGSCTWMANRSFTDGAPNPLFSIAAFTD